MKLFIVVIHNIYVYNVNIPFGDILGVQSSIFVLVLCTTTFSFQAVVRFLIVSLAVD